MALPKSLVEGYRRYVRDRHAPERGRFEQLAALGQAPTALVIACCDARVDVSAIFDAAPGDLFILRNIANLVPPYEGDGEGGHHGTSAAIEYATMVLKVPHLIVLGHSHCGGIDAYRKGAAPREGIIGRWLQLLDGAEALEEPGASGNTGLELAGVRLSLQNLRTFPSVRQREEAGLLSLEGAHFDIGSGTLLALPDGGNRFAPVS